MTSLLRRVKVKTAIHAHRKVRGVLDGEYGSIHKGRSMDFDDLREYVLGDDVKDIDWKATARSGRPLVKRYVATRQHAVMLVVDTGRSMAALADADEHQARRRRAGGRGRRPVGAIVTAISSVSSPGRRRRRRTRAQRRSVVYMPPGRREVHIERILRAIHDGIDADWVSLAARRAPRLRSTQPATPDDPRRHRRRRRPHRSPSRPVAPPPRPARGAVLQRSATWR